MITSLKYSFFSVKDKWLFKKKQKKNITKFKTIEELFLRSVVVQRSNVFLTDVERFPIYAQGPSKYGGYRSNHSCARVSLNTRVIVDACTSKEYTKRAQRRFLVR